MTRQTAYHFFLKHAGYSWNTATGETRRQGRIKSAQSLARAERKAADREVEFEWSQDEIDSSDFSDEVPPWTLWRVVARVNGEVFASLGGIDFGRDRDPWMDPYKRVVEAELACELPEVERLIDARFVIQIPD